MSECPLCSHPLTFVEHVIVRNEFPLLSLSTQTDDTGKVLLSPLLSAGEKESTLMEVLERTVQCSSAGCQYYIEEENLGDIIWGSPDGSQQVE